MNTFSVGWEITFSMTACVTLSVCSKSIFLWVLYCHVIGNLHSVFKCGLLNSFIVAVTIHLFFDGNIR